MDEVAQARGGSVADSLRPVSIPVVTALVNKVLTLGYKLTGKDRYDDYRLERVAGMPILVIPTVLNPKLTRSGAFFASRIDGKLVGAGSEVLDMGTGSGVCALFAARYAARVVAVDINEAAVRCTNINARLNNLESRIDARQGDLFSPVATEKFDLVLFNPPFLRGTPRNDRDRAWRSNDVAERFAAGLGAHLKPGGSALVMLSTFGDCRHFLDEFNRHGLKVSVFAERRFVNERLALFRLTPRTAPEQAALNASRPA